jgi:uncharacterized protein YndB with AHSA1/START domain
MSLEITHGKFVIERVYNASPQQVFAAWADPAVKARWFIGPESWTQIKRELDFRNGGEELLQGRIGTTETLFRARFHDIVDAERIVYVYDMHLSGKYHSVSVATVEFRAAGASTKLIFTEQVAFLDGTPSADSREHGTAAHLDRLAGQLRNEPNTAR